MQITSKFRKGINSFLFHSLLLLLFSSHGLAALKGEYYNGHNFDTFIGERTDGNIDFDWGKNAPMKGVSSSSFSVRWTGTIQPTVSGAHRFQVSGTHAARLWINEILVLDTWSWKYYNKLAIDAGKWDRLAEGVIALKKDQRYDIKLEFAKANQAGQLIPASIQLKWGNHANAGEVISASRLQEAMLGKVPQMPRSARSFYENIGINFHQSKTGTSATDFDKTKQRLAELDVFSVRTGRLAKQSNREQLKNLYDTLGIKSTITMRENFERSDPEVRNTESNMNQVHFWIKDVAPAVLMVTGGNEPNRPPERFIYNGHGYRHTDGEVIGEGWQTGVAYFMRDLWKKLKSDPVTKDLAVCTPTYGAQPYGIGKGMDQVYQRGLNKGFDLHDFADYGNIHKYHTNYPEEGQYHGFTRDVRTLTGDLRKPFVATEFGYHTGTKAGKLQVSEPVQAMYLMRNFAEMFNTGYKYSYSFSLWDGSIHHGETHKWGLIRQDWSAKPSYWALKNLIALIKDSENPIHYAPLDYELTGDLTDIRQTLLRKSDGRYYLLIWLGIRSTDDPVERNLRLSLGEAKANIKVYEPYKRYRENNIDPVQSYSARNTIDLSVRDNLRIVEIALE